MKATLAGINGTLGVGRDKLTDHLFGHAQARHTHHAWNVRDSPAGPAVSCWIKVSAMPQLGEDFHRPGSAGCHQSGIVVDDIIVKQTERKELAGPMNAGCPKYGKPAATFGTTRVIGNIIVAHPPGHLQPAMGGPYDAIGQLNRTDAKGLENAFQHGRFSPRFQAATLFSAPSCASYAS